MDFSKVHYPNQVWLIFATLCIAGCTGSGPPTEKNIKESLDSKITVTEIHSIKADENKGSCHYKAWLSGTKGYDVVMSYNHNLGNCGLGTPFYACGDRSFKKTACFYRLEKGWGYSIPP